MYTLYYSPGSASMAPHGVLEESGAPYTLTRVDMAANKHKDAAYLIWGRLDQALAMGPYLLGERFSGADIYLHMLYSWMDPPMQMDARYPSVAHCAGLVAARPAIKRALQQNQAA